jgi:hypothetical protein
MLRCVLYRLTDVSEVFTASMFTAQQPEDNHLLTSRHENLKSHKLEAVLLQLSCILFSGCISGTRLEDSRLYSFKA